jgi:hypothetical protein
VGDVTLFVTAHILQNEVYNAKKRYLRHFFLPTQPSAHEQGRYAQIAAELGRSAETMVRFH